uniref:GTPase Der n=2 Tax=uncultured Chloroflexota bacterium TaxID=166587 RepID=H5SL39_9CHLR|nr:small GTP-binding protein [uncultured Chloroflexota bacterium]
MNTRKPLVALVGRPNVGKSTLFNRFVGERLAIVDETPGTTRDRIFGSCEWNGQIFDVVDTGGIDPQHGGRSPLSTGSAEFIEEIRRQALLGVENADIVLFLTDGQEGPTPADHEIARLLRRHQKKTAAGKLSPPILLVVNKCESEAQRAASAAFYELGLGEPHAISALHGTGTGDLLDRIVELLPRIEESEEEDSVKIAIVGKPNVGKSSLLNRLLGEERVIVSPIPGTTRDAIDTHLEYQGVPITLIDTAGIRRRGRIEPGVETYSVLRSLQAIDRADVVLLVIDATSGITAQDAHIAGFILEAWKSCVVVVNKWDAIQKDSQTMEKWKQQIRQELNFMDYVPALFVSARTGQRVDQILPTALKVQEERLARIPTSRLNQLLQKAQDRQPPPAHAGRQLKIFYATQVRAAPPTFLIYVNEPSLMHFTYMRYLENCIRAEYPFTGTPIRLVTKGRHE